MYGDIIFKEQQELIVKRQNKSNAQQDFVNIYGILCRHIFPLCKLSIVNHCGLQVSQVQVRKICRDNKVLVRLPLHSTGGYTYSWFVNCFRPVKW